LQKAQLLVSRDQLSRICVPRVQRPCVDMLIVDDRQENLDALSDVLEGPEVRISFARSGQEALKCTQFKDFAVILLDVHMPDMDGFETAELIRNQKRTSTTPIIFVTSSDRNDALIAKGYSLGAVDYIFKPCPAPILRSKVKVFIELFQKTEKIRLQGERLRKIDEHIHRNKLRKTTQMLEMETKRNRFFVLSLNLLAIAGMDGYLKQLNPSWERTLGFSEKELKERPMLDFVHADDRSIMEEALRNIANGISSVDFEARYLCANGTFKWLGWTAAPFIEEGLVYIFAREITLQKEAEQKVHNLNLELAHRVDELTAVNQELETFSYSVSHDLRAPLRHVNAFVALLEERSASVLDDESIRYLRTVGDAAKKMDVLIEDLLAFSKMGRKEMLQTNVDLTELVHEIYAEVSLEYSQENVSFTVDSLPTVQGDPSMLRIVLNNLIRNAFKYTQIRPNPVIEIGSNALSDDEISIFIRDNGVGFDMQYYNLLFGVFQRLHSADEFDGTGIGLAMVRRIILRHGGNIWAEGMPDVGATFYISLPRYHVAQS
jgi:PAS domain S-box-containing protein